MTSAEPFTPGLPAACLRLVLPALHKYLMDAQYILATDRYLSIAAAAKTLIEAKISLFRILETLLLINKYACSPALTEEDVLICIDAAYYAVYDPLPRWTGWGPKTATPATPAPYFQDDQEVPFV